MAAVTDKTFYSPYVTVHTGSTSYAEVTGVIVHSIQVTSDNTADEIEISVTPLGADSEDIKVPSGDTIYGPFTAYEITTSVADVAIIVHEKDRIINNL